MNRRRLVACAAVLGAFPLPSGSAEAAASTADFVKTAGIAGMFEIESSKLALTKSEAADIKAFADKMIHDHTLAAAELSDLAKGKYSVPDALDATHKDLMDQLDKLIGPDFDKLYAKVQTQAHQEAVGLFGDYSSTGEDTSLKQFAAKTLPTLQEHLDMIKAIDAKMAPSAG